MTSLDSLPSLINGVTVTVKRPIVSETLDEMGEPIGSGYEVEEVSDVLFSPTATEDVSGALFLKNIEVDAEFHFPKTYQKQLRGCLIAYGGREYSVIGDIRRYIPENTPTRWNGAVSAREVS